MTSSRSVLGGVLTASAALGAAALAWGTLVEPRRFTLREYELAVLPTGSRPVRILHLSDLHLAPWQQAKQEWVRSLAALAPDLVITTGDNFGHPDALAGLAHTLEPFAGIPGAFVYGSNDYFGPVPKNPFVYLGARHRGPRHGERLDVDGLTELLAERLGWAELNNAAAAIDLPGLRLELFGVDDPHIDLDRLGVIPGALERVREEHLDDTVPVFTIGLTHAPYRRVLDAFVTQGAELILAGHTHGGQVRIPGLPPLATNCDIPPEQAQGVSLWEHARHAAVLEVSAGLGASIYAPVRFAVPPEASLLTLSAVR